MPFDVDLGPDHAGHVVAVYSRCRREPANLSIQGPLPAYRTGRGCRLYRFDLATRRERRIAGLGERPSSFLPTIWRSRLAWAESTDPDYTGHEPAPRLVLKEARKRPRLLPGGTPPERDTGFIPQPGPLVLDLRGRRLTFTWRYNPTRWECGRIEQAGPLGNSEVWLHTIGRRRQRLAHAGCPEDGALGRVAWSALAPGTLAYVVTENGVDRLRRVDMRTGVRSDAALALPTQQSHFVDSFAELGNGRFAYYYDGSSSGLAVDRPVSSAAVN